MLGMLTNADFIAIISTARPAEARAFYVNVLGLDFVRDEPQALVLRANGRYLRIQKVDELPPPRGSALGWEVDDIERVAEELATKGVALERYHGLPQDDHAIATFPNGDKVGWFLDPDGNILSIAQLVA